jgi:hypothetical protein
MVNVTVKGETYDVNTDKLSDDDYRRVVVRGLESYIGEKGDGDIKATILRSVIQPKRKA